jgi:hypothetical protein
MNIQHQMQWERDVEDARKLQQKVWELEVALKHAEWRASAYKDTLQWIEKLCGTENEDEFYSTLKVTIPQAIHDAEDMVSQH